MPKPPDFTLRLMELQAKADELQHKVDIATGFLEKYNANVHPIYQDMHVNMALLVLKRRFTT